LGTIRLDFHGVRVARSESGGPRPQQRASGAATAPVFEGVNEWHF
jgi:hypothetical protein